MLSMRKVSNSVSSDYCRVLGQITGILWSAYRGLEEGGELTESRARAFAEKMARTARAYLQRGRKDDALHCLQEAKKMEAAGIADAYTGAARWLYRALGAVQTEKLIGLRRGLASDSQSYRDEV
jgi:hypothetical protein